MGMPSGIPIYILKKIVYTNRKIGSGRFGPADRIMDMENERMKKYELIVPCHFGTESVLKREIMDIGYDISEVTDGRVSFWGDEEAVARANVFLRSAERILIKIGSFQAMDYEELFQGTKAIAWEDWIPSDGKCWVTKAASVKSKLFSPSDIQRVMKKAIADRLQDVYRVNWLP